MSTSPLEVCPANLDGTISASGSWPASSKFVSCLPLDGAGGAALPASDGNSHVAFALRPLAKALSASVRLTVSYSPADTFVAVIPPRRYREGRHDGYLRARILDYWSGGLAGRHG
jgi:hypothetical protein